MSKFYLFLFLFAGIFSHAQVINFPDINFKNKLLEASSNNGIARDFNGDNCKIDTNNDSQIQVSEAQAIWQLNLDFFNLSSLVGINNFTALNSLTCRDNNLTALDVSALVSMVSFNCAGNEITTLNVGSIPLLESLSCSYNQLTSLNVSQLPALMYLYCDNNSLTSLNLTGMTTLRTVECHSNLLTALPLAGCSNIYSMTCYGNQLMSLDVQQMPDLEYFYCYQNALTALNFSNMVKLRHIECYDNALTSLQVISNPDLLDVKCYNNNLATLDVSNNLILDIVDCHTNQLTSINTSGCPNLKYIHANENLLPQIDLSQNPNLNTLEVKQNALTSLLVMGLSSLHYLECSNNQLTTLSVAGLTTLYNFRCSNNQLTDLDISGVTDFYSLYCDNNQLTALNMTEITTPYFLNFDCHNNAITSLDFSNCRISQADCSNNNLDAIFLKNDFMDSVQLAGNPNLRYICADDITGNEIYIYQNIADNFGYNCTVNTYCSFVPGGDYYEFQGTATFDGDGNGCDANDGVVGQIKFIVESQTNMDAFVSDATGDYNIPLGYGPQTLTPIIDHPEYYTISPSVITINFPLDTSPFAQDFCITANGQHNNLKVTLLPVTAARPGFDAQYRIVYENVGTVTLSGSVDFNFEDVRMDAVSTNPLPASQSFGTMNWPFVNLAPFESRNIDVVLNINSPLETPAVNGGDQLNFGAVINPIENDEAQGDNTFGLKQVVVNSMDPNDKTCLEGTTVTSEAVGEYVHYLIRFENTGTYAAENIVVSDLIDLAKFDINSLAPLTASHSFETRISSGNKVEFVFQNINLPFDAASNDGFVAFRIKTKPTLIVGENFTNTASIYFDYNFPIVTNTATTTITALANPDFEFSDYITVYPNPAKNELNMKTNDSIAVKSIAIYNLLGQLVLAIPNAEQVSTIDVSDLKSGNYFITITSDKGSSSAKFIKM